MIHALTMPIGQGRRRTAAQRPIRGLVLGSFYWGCLLPSLLAVSGWAAEPILIRSHSGQFLVRGLPVGAPLLNQSLTSQVHYVRLDPAVLVVSLERIKHALLKELDAEDAWQGLVSVLLHPVQRDHEPIVVTALRTKSGWGFRLEVPEIVRQDRFLKAVVQVLLMELANRHAGERLAEMPPWLSEGLTAHLQSTTLATFTLEPHTTTVRHGYRRDPLLAVRACLRTNTPLILDELNLPTEEHFSEANAAVYRHCAHLFMYELLHLKTGPACLRSMLALLHRYYNWQTAFLHAFAAPFPRMLDVDKWWALHVVSVTGRDPFSLWPLAQSWRKLDAALQVPVDVRVSPGELPMTTDVNLHQVITEWDFAKQAPLLRQKLGQLQALRLRVVPELAALAGDYSQVLQTYLHQRAQTVTWADNRQPPPSFKLIVKQAVRRIEDLDARREFLRRKTQTAQARPNF